MAFLEEYTYKCVSFRATAIPISCEQVSSLHAYVCIHITKITIELTKFKGNAYMFIEHLNVCIHAAKRDQLISNFKSMSDWVTKNRLLAKLNSFLVHRCNYIG